MSAEKGWKAQKYMRHTQRDSINTPNLEGGDFP